MSGINTLCFFENGIACFIQCPQLPYPPCKKIKGVPSPHDLQQTFESFELINDFFECCSIAERSSKCLSKLNLYSADNCLGLDLTMMYWHFLAVLWLYLFIFLKFL